MSTQKTTSERVEEKIRNYVGDFDKGAIFLELNKQTGKSATSEVKIIIGQVIHKLQRERSTRNH